MDYISKLGQFGYILKKSKLSNEELISIRNDLTIAPNVIKGYGAKPLSFPVYKETKNHIILPKYYGIKRFGNPGTILKEKYEKINVKFNGKLRPKQEEITNDILNHIQKEKRCLLALNTGGGKTVISLDIISQLKRKALIVVHKEFLMEQWRDRIQQFLPSAKIGYIQGDKCDIEGKDIIIGMIQSLCKRNYGKDFLKDIGLTLIDEVHHIGSRVFTQALLKVNKQYMLGLSATPKRKDGLTCVLNWTFGKFIVPVIEKKRNNVHIKMIEYHPNVIEKRLYRGGGINIQNMTNQLCDDIKRTTQCINIIIEQYQLNKDILVLSDRVEHIKYMYSSMEKSGYDSGLYIGGMKEQERNISSNKRIIFATYQMVSEAFDVPRLNTLIMCTPKKDIIQIVGRILRKQHQDFNPLVVDLWDKVSVFERWGFQRIRYYKKMDYKLNKINETSIENSNEPNIVYCFNDSDDE